MMYITRHLEKTAKEMGKYFGATLITGARQVGKTTVLKHMEGNINYVTMDDPFVLQTAVNQPGEFFKSLQLPVILDEIQYAPHLFPFFKMHIDTTHKPGQFFMTGSQQFVMMKNVSESLAGRMGILQLCGLSLRELHKEEFCDSFIPTKEYLTKRRKTALPIKYSEIWRMIQRGSLPELWAKPHMDWEQFYSAYLKTYIERDVRALAQVGDELKFLKFLTVLAAHLGDLLNLSSIAKEVGISAPTADKWLSILVASNIVYLLRPFFSNITKRETKMPKIYFLDTGLAAYLTGWSTPEVLQKGAMAGAFFENFVITEIVKSYYNNGKDLPMYFYRDKDKKEIDLLIFSNGTLYPLEIKKHADPSTADLKNFRVLDKLTNFQRGTGGVICFYDNLLPLTKEDFSIPLSYI